MSISTCPFCGCSARFDRPWQTEYLCGTIVHQDAPSHRGQPCEKIVALRGAKDALRMTLEMVRDADNDCRMDGLQTIPEGPRRRIDEVLEGTGGAL